MISSFSNTKDFTTRIAPTFSSTTLFKASYLLNTRSMIGCTFFEIKNKPNPKIGITIKKIKDRLLLIDNAKHRDIININGARTAILIII